MGFQEIKSQLGLLAGITYLFTFIFITPILIYLDPEFDISILDFDPLSQLGVSSETILYYNIVMFFDGIFLFLYYHWYLSQTRSEYEYLKGWDISITTGKTAGVGQIGLAVFFNIDILHSLHIISGILFFGGITLSMLITSLDLTHISKLSNHIRVLTGITLFIVIWGISYPFLFRFTDHIGLWQFVIVVAMFCWYIFENYSYVSLVPILKENKTNDYHYPLDFIYKTGIILGILLIIIGFALLIFPKYDPSPCGEVGDRKNCHPMDNVISGVAGMILVLFSWYIKKSQYIRSPGAVLK